MDREAEVERLKLADRHIAQAEQHITQQQLVVEHLRNDSPDAQGAQRLLRNMHEALASYGEHRRLIVEMIEQIDTGLA